MKRTILTAVSLLILFVLPHHLSAFCRATILATGAENSGKNWLLGKEFGGAYDAGQRIPENGG
jgi:hypothetical protein